MTLLTENQKDQFKDQGFLILKNLFDEEEIKLLKESAIFDKELDKLLSHGFELACRLYADGVDAAYVDTRDFNGVFTELHGDPNHILGEFARWKRAHDISQPGDNIHLKRVNIND